MSALRADLARGQRKLDDLAPGTIIADMHGHAWQKDRGDYWYRAFDSDEPVDSWGLTQFLGGRFETLREPS